MIDKEQVVNRLQSLGYEYTESDDWAIAYLSEKTERYILDLCNVEELPDGLSLVAVDMVCGEFLTAKKAVGGLEGFEVENAVAQIREGDTAISYVADGNVINLDWLLNYLKNQGREQFIKYRRLSW